jgi:hypothetical protein
LPRERWIRSGSEAVRVEKSESAPELVRVLAKTVEKAPANASVRQVIRMSSDLQRGSIDRLAARLAPAVGSVFCWGTAATIIIMVSPNSPVGALLPLPSIFLVIGGVMFGSMFYEQIRGLHDEE